MTTPHWTADVPDAIWENYKLRPATNEYGAVIVCDCGQEFQPPAALVALMRHLGSGVHRPTRVEPAKLEPIVSARPVPGMYR